MSIEISAQTSGVIMQLLQDVETGTDLRNLAVINRVGMAVASSQSASPDATAVTATSSALIDLAEKMSESIQHGNLHELLIRSTLGYDVLMAVSKDLMIFASLLNPLRVGYALGFLREICSKIRSLIANELPAEQLEIFKKQEEERTKKEPAAPLIKPSLGQDIDAMKGVIGFLEDWGEEEGEAVITPEMIAQARATSAVKAGRIAPAPDLTKGIPGELISSEAIQGNASERLADEGSTGGQSTIVAGIEVYEDEIPPIPLDDITTDMQLSGSQPSAVTSPTPITSKPVSKTPVKPPEPSVFDYKTFAEEYGYNDAAIYDDKGTVVDFESADEYDFDLDLNEQDAMSEALKALGWVEEKDAKKKAERKEE